MEKRTIQGIILQGVGGFYYVKTADGVLECRAKGIFRKQGITPLAGDSVTALRETPTDDWTVSDIERRKNWFIRPPVANVDCAFLVVSAVEPVPGCLLADRLSALFCSRGVKTTIVLTKTDLANANSFEQIYTKAGFEVLNLQKDPENALKRIKRRASCRLSVFCGNSGVGKSTLLNLLLPDLRLKTGETSKKLGRGRHTTRAVTLYDFEGGYLADTPGFSSLEFDKETHIAKENLAHCFLDFVPYLDGCRFSNCTHRTERGCALLEAVAQKKVQSSRHESYLTLYRELESAGQREYQ